MTDKSCGLPPVSASAPACDESRCANDEAGKLKAPLISVCMSVYNAQRYVAESVESILGQTFQDFEFLITDDGSTDRSLAILERCAAQDARIRLSSAPNAGLVTRLNEMLRQARGELIARMDADDVALPERFARQVEFLRSHPEVDVVGGAQEHIDSEGHFLMIQRDLEGHEEIEERAFIGWCPINHPSVMMRREAALAVGGYREMPAEDFDLWLRMGERGRLANLPDVITRYRIHDASGCAVLQHAFPDVMQAAVDRACDRRGVPRRKLEFERFRPVDRATKHQLAILYGWAAFHRGDRPAAVYYGRRAVFYKPWQRGGWMLLACALLKMKAAKSEAPRPLPPARDELQQTGDAAEPLRTPLVSVCMIVYNAERYVAEAVESILNQTLSDFELLIVDDGSTDTSAGILKKYAASNRRIRLTCRSNRGIVASRNELLDQARGEFVAVLDADDVALPERLQQQVDYLRAHPECVEVGSPALVIDPEGDPLTVWFTEQGHETIDTAHLQGEKGGLLCHSSVMMRRSAVLAVGKYRDFPIVEDFDLHLRLAEHGRLANLAQVLVKYRTHGNNMSRDPRHFERIDRDLCTIIQEAHQRRRLPLGSPPSRRASAQAGGNPLEMWLWWALSSGHVKTARKYARRILAGAPLSLHSWKLVYCALRGH